MVYISALSKTEIKTRLKNRTQKAFFLGNEYSGHFVLWEKQDYFEVTYPTFIGQTSFCAYLKEDGGVCKITGRYMLNHFLLLELLICFILAPIMIHFLTGGGKLPTILSIFLLLGMGVIYFFVSPLIGRKGNEAVEQFIVDNLLK